MPPEPRQVPLSPHPDAAGRRLHIHGIQEMPAGYDAEVAELFRDLRAATALSEMDLAARLGTRADVVQSLEQGALYALPPWAETCRVVNAYGALLNLDVRPLLRRIYAQLEAGIVELQPKPMPDVPMMTPPAEPQDYSFAPSNSGGSSAPNPLDIPWPPPAQQAPPPQRNAWPNGPTAPQPQPQAPWPNVQPQRQPQAPWPNQQQPQQQPQAWPGNQPAPQAPRPNPQQQPQPPRQAQPQGQPQGQPQRQAQPRAPQAQPPQPQVQARPQPMPQRPAQPPEPHPLDADFGEAIPLEPTAEPQKPKRRRPALLKWGLGALVISIVAFGLWMALTHAPGPAGITGGQTGATDPDDPRSRKADRLPSPPGG
jgi:hypothetical protein